MTHTSQNVDAARAFYTGISSIYDRLTERDEKCARDLGLSLLAARRGERVLEIGFGTGASIASMSAAVGTSGAVVGIDISRGMWKMAEKRIEDLPSAANITLTVGAVPPIPFGDRSFDGVFTAFTLELFPDDTIPSVLEEVRRTLRDEGRFAVVSMVRNADESRGVPERFYDWLHLHFPRVVDCRPIDVEHWLTLAGFMIVRNERLRIWGLPVVAILAKAESPGL